LAAATHYKGWREALRLEIEGLAFDPARARLLIGLRGPVWPGRSLVIALENPDAAFAGARPRLSLLPLDLGGGGIRALEYVPALHAFVLTARNEDFAGAPFTFWRWSGEAGSPPGRLHPPRIRGGLRHPEGVAPVTIRGQRGLLVVSDDGSTAKGRAGHYLFLSYARLVPAPKGRR